MESAVLRVGSLFAGIGGFDFAAERAGMTVSWQSEIDQKASAVLSHHWPNVPNLGDIHGINAPPTVDVLTGGFPCQDYSIAGKREGLAGDRGALWWQYHRLIDAIRPTWVVGENVTGLLSSRNGADLQVIIDSLTKCGYGVAWAVLDAQYFGVAQRRRRVFIVGHSGGEPRPEILALSEGLCEHLAPHRQVEGDFAGTLEARHPTQSRSQFGHNHLIVNGASSIRHITPLECERLQGFPDHWTDTPGNSATQRYRQLGNAVTVPVVQWILHNIFSSRIG